MSLQLQEGETLLKEGIANYQRGKGIEGSLGLTNERLHFASNLVNIQRYEQTYPLALISSASVHNVAKFIPNGITITLANGQRESFLVFEHSDWLYKINNALDQHQQLRNQREPSKDSIILNNKENSEQNPGFYKEADKDNIIELIDSHKKRLQILQKKEALFGMSVEPSVIIEIEEVKQKIQLLNLQLQVFYDK